ncbi:MAG: glycosyltransferase, partial [Chitinophagaceae bacterium]
YNDVEVLNYAGRSSTFKNLTKKVFSSAAVCISVSRFLADGVNRLVVKKEFTIIPNVVDTDLFYYKERTATPFRFIHVSNMVPLKNAEGILRAFKLLLEQGHAAELHMVGDTQPAIRKYAADIGLTETAVYFYGEISYTAVATKIQETHSLIVNSNIENSPCVIGEALCCGLPVIATKVGGVPELADSNNAILIEPGNDAALAASMQQLMKTYQQYDTKKIAENARGKFSYPVIGKQFDAVYSALITGPAALSS